MRLKVLGSNSRGNGYILENDKEALIIEAGIHLLDAKKALNFNIAKVSTAIVSHEHNDHAGYIDKYLDTGITTLCSAHVVKAKSLKSSFVRIVEANKGYKAGSFRIIPFNLKHDVPCLGYIVEHDDMGRLLFITDTMMCEYTFPNLNHILLECNYADDILTRNIEAGQMDAGMRSRLMHTHMELNTCKGILKANNLNNVMNIVLIHLSDGNSDEKRFIDEITALTGKQVYAANKGLELEISKTPF
ncbi:MAG: MBL fold metallo-hydrolase [Cytophagaceae bacterium]|jgi:phosphoribosyl 1,2-cyclic phosphodiesterase|nr:MBL fold metallo-hydrolase [Cytophagaceae bacterium]